MYYPDNKEYITFLFSLLDEFAEAKQIPSWNRAGLESRVKLNGLKQNRPL